MEWLHQLISNRFLITGVTSWFVAQLAKTIIYAIINKKLVLERMVGDGGMPSGHSATVTSLAIIVCHDAMGVRLETGKQAQIINEMMEAFEVWTKKELPEVKLKEFVGHTPIQVIAGILLGIANGCVMHYLIFPLF